MERKYLSGFYVHKKESKFGSFLKCSIKYDTFLNNATPNKKGYINFCIFENKEGKPYAVVDNYEDNKSTVETNKEQIIQFDEEIPF